jgi:hypothetical protein
VAAARAGDRRSAILRLQVDPYEVLRERPASRAVAQVLGLRNVVVAEIVDGWLSMPTLGLHVPWTGMTVPGPMLAYVPPDRLVPGPCPNGWISVDGVVEEIVSLPQASVVHLVRGDGRLQAVVTRASLDVHCIATGATVKLSFDPRTLHLLPAAIGAQTAVR